MLQEWHQKTKQNKTPFRGQGYLREGVGTVSRGQPPGFYGKSLEHGSPQTFMGTMGNETSSEEPTLKGQLAKACEFYIRISIPMCARYRVSAVTGVRGSWGYYEKIQKRSNL